MYTVEDRTGFLSLAEGLFLVWLNMVAKENRSVILMYADEYGHATGREIRPETIENTNAGNTLLRAWCFSRDEYRSFRFDRIVDYMVGNVLPTPVVEDTFQTRVEELARHTASRYGLDLTAYTAHVSLIQDDHNHALAFTHETMPTVYGDVVEFTDDGNPEDMVLYLQ